MKSSPKTLDKFELGEREFDDAVFAGVRVKRTDDGFELSQEKYVENLSILPIDTSFSN